MNLIYNSSNFCVYEFSDFGETGQHPAGGYEIMDKGLRREIFLGGRDAEQFRDSVQALISQEPTADEVDEFLHGYSALMTQPLVQH